MNEVRYQDLVREVESIPLLDDRQRKEVLFSMLYEEDFRHGTDGHVRLMLVARLARIILNLMENKHAS